MLSITQQKKNVLSDLHVHCKRLLATISHISFYVLHYGSRHFNGLFFWFSNGLKKKEDVPNKSTVQHDFCCFAQTFEIFFKYM